MNKYTMLKSEKIDRSLLWSEAYSRAFIRFLTKVGSQSEPLTHEESKQYVFLGVKFMASRLSPELKTEEYIQARIQLIFRINTELEKLTPREFITIFPITKDYSKWEGCKNYFTVTEDIKRWDKDKPIGEPASEFLWEYLNRDIMEYMVEYMSAMSDCMRLEGKQGLMEGFCQEQGIPTYTLREKEGYMQNNTTGEISRISKPKKRVPKYMTVVD